MPKFYYSLLFLIFSFSAIAQNSITIKGKVFDEVAKLPMESATIYLTSAQDSTIVDYTISDKNGNFSMTTKKILKPTFLKVSFQGYDDFKQEIPSLSENKDFGTINIIENAKNLNEVVIKGEAPPVRIKKDTLEFNASSFKVLPDSNVETLLKKLPGVEIDANGKITVNGKEVNNILVNGKPFFGKDGKVATENLPADIIDKVQITDTKTKSEELSGDAASSENKTINLTIQEDKNKGLFGKFSGGLGSDDRYESSGLINYFKNKQKLSFLGASNNINSVGFSMDEIFDSMGGGRNIYSSSDGSFNIDGQQFGGSTGITQSNLIGLNYADEFANKKLEPNGSYFYNSAETNNDNRSKTENLLPENKFTTESTNKTRNVANAHNLNFELRYKIDSLTTLDVTPNIKRSNSRNTSNRIQTSVNESQELLNDSQSYTNSSGNNATFANNLYFFRKMKKKGRSLSLSFNNNNTADENDFLRVSQTNFYKDNTPSDIRNQNEKTKNTSDLYEGNFTYSEPLTDSLSFSVGAKYLSSMSIDRKNTFDFNGFTSEYDIENALLTNFISSQTNTINPYASFSVRKKKYNARIGFGTEVTKYTNFSDYLDERVNLNKNYFFPTVNGYINYTLSKSKSIYVNYNYRNNLPTANQLLPVENLSNPLNTIIGNPDLDATNNHSFYLGFNNYDWPTRSGFYLYSGGNYYTNQIVSSTVFDQNFKSVTTFENIDNTYNFWGGFEYSKSYKKEKNTFKYTVGIGTNFDLGKGLTNNALYESRSYSLAPRIELSYEYGDIFTFSPSYTYDYIKNNFTNYIIDQSSNFTHNFKLETTSRWPKNLVFGNDFGYNYNANISDGFKKDFYLWNSSLGYNFFKEKFLAKVKVYDLLNQNIATSRTITPTAIQDVQNTVLRRYIMFSVTYKIEKFGGKKKSEW